MKKLEDKLKSIDPLIAKKSILVGFSASFILLTVYFSILTFVSGWSFAKVQFLSYWYFIISLALGFGIQVSLFTYLKTAVRNMAGSGKMVVATGATSTAAMISCCSHYLVNLIPIIGITGFVTIVSQYQVQFFYVGLAFNFLGIVYMLKRLNNFLKSSAKVLS